ncbi:hypothetical protein L7F22_051135 [Adiantum nelumboides]|nr:hypothetical protein [Adiantum nelumboides]
MIHLIFRRPSCSLTWSCSLPSCVSMLNFGRMETLLSQSSATTLSTAFPSSGCCMTSSPLELSEPFCLPSLDFLSANNNSSSPPASKKRKPNIPDLQAYQEQLVLTQPGWMLMNDNSCHTQSWKNGDFSLLKAAVGHSQALLHRDDHASNNISAAQNLHDLEDVLDFLWAEDDTASTAQSEGSFRDSSDNEHLPFLIMDLDWDYCSANESSSNLFGESSNEDRQGGGELVEVGTSSKQQDEKCHVASYMARARSSWQRTDGQSALMGARQQRLLQGGIRASWQDAMVAAKGRAEDGIRGAARWQDGAKAILARDSWQSKPGGEGRASWQQALAGGVGGGEGRGGGASSSAGWAGPTLLDIESALALTDQSMSAPPTPTSTRHMPVSPFLDVKALLAQGDMVPQLQDSQNSSWRLKLQKRSSQEPKYTIRMESEEKALGDGYRWRKYGQKSIKNSPFPRSYYRCSTGKCNAKKQVEKSQEEEGVFLVTYEGIHLHHKPNMIHKCRVPSDGLEDEKEKCTSSDTVKSPSSPSSSTACSHSIPPNN